MYICTIYVVRVVGCIRVATLRCGQMRSRFTAGVAVQRVGAFKSVTPHAPRPPGSSWGDPVVVIVPERCLPRCPTVSVCVCGEQSRNYP